MKCELLAPAGSLECLYAAINNGATSIYLGGSVFNARMYANNFNDEELKEAIDYVHKRNVKIFVTLNILINDNELKEVKEYIKSLYLLNIDGIIVQDFGIINFILDNYKDLFLSCSTQTTIDDLEGVLFFEKLGAKRVVLAREVSLENVKNIIDNSNIEIEVFAHGALCVCYSGQCLMSSYIGNRSGNRGKCAQPCRKTYSLIDASQNKIIVKDDYVLSLKDLKTIDNLDKILDLNIHSLKLEGRMKNPEYVANITRAYRLKLDNYYNNKTCNLEKINTNLTKTFHRQFTCGYLFNDEIKNMHSNKNNVGQLIGKVTNTNYKGYIEITLSSPLAQNDIIRFDSKNEVSTKLVRLFDANLKLVNSCINKAYIKINENVPLNTKVYKTFDYLYDQELKNTIHSNNYKNPIDISINAKINDYLSINIKYMSHTVSYTSNYLIEEAKTSPLDKERIINQINKFNDTPYFLNKISLNMDNNIFISIKALNELRRNALELLEEKILSTNRSIPSLISLPSLNIKKEELVLSFKVHTIEQYNYLKSLGYNYVYFDNNSSNKANNKYNIKSDYILVKNYGSLYKYSEKELIIDYSLNTYNHLSAYYFFKLGAKRVTPSIELSTTEYIDLYNNYLSTFNESPNLEFIAYSNVELMYSKYCPLKKYNQCGKCRNKQYILEDNFDKFILYTDDNCYSHLLASKKLNKIKDIQRIKNYSSAIRIELLNETNDEIKKIIDEVNHQLSI